MVRQRPGERPAGDHPRQRERRQLRRAGATRWAAAFGAAALAAGLLWASIGAIPFGADPCPLGVEGSGYTTRWTWWPPGATRCIYTTPEGTVHESTYVPWQEWATVAVCALGVALGAFAAMTARHRWRAAYGAVVLIVGGLAIWFIGPIAALVTAVAVAPAAIRLRPA